MTKEAMIKVLRYKAEHIKTKIRQEFFAEVADMLEQEPCGDCVSRAELKKWLDMNFSFGGASRKFELFDRLDKELPPVTPKQKVGHWIHLDKVKQAMEEIENRATYDGIYIDRADVLEILDKLIESEGKE